MAVEPEDDTAGPDAPDSNGIEFLTFEDICEIHDRGLREFGFGMPGFLDEHTAPSAAGQPQAAIMGKYLYEFPAGMAAVYLYYLSNQQGFLTGNKRTAVGSALEFLARNGYRLKTTNLELFQFVIRVASADVKIERHIILKRIKRWIESRLVPLD